jgi:hypothetical protein
VDRLKGLLDLLLEGFSGDVGADGDVGVADPGIQGALIQVPGHFDALVSGHVVLQGVELLSAVGSRGEEDDAVVSPVSESDPAPALLIHDGLELLLGDVGGRVGSAPVAEDDGGRLAHFCQAGEVVLGVHLEADEKALETDAFLDVELAHHDHAAGLHHQGRDFWHGQHAEPLGGEVFVDPVQGSTLACAWPSGDGDLVDGVFRHVADGVVLHVVLEVDLVEGVLEILDADLFVLEGGLQEGAQLILLATLLVEAVESGGQSAKQDQLGGVLRDLLNNDSHQIPIISIRKFPPYIIRHRTTFINFTTSHTIAFSYSHYPFLAFLLSRLPYYYNDECEPTASSGTQTALPYEL